MTSQALLQRLQTCLKFALGLWLVAGIGCTKGPTAPLDLTTLDPDQDQFRIASAYAREAAALRLKAQEQVSRATQYERLFGHSSDWVAGVRLLAQFYEETAQEREDLAAIHLSIARGRSPSQRTP